MTKEKKKFDSTTYKNDFNRANYRRYQVCVRKDDIAVISKLDSVSSINAYINKLIHDDIAKNSEK